MENDKLVEIDHVKDFISREDAVQCAVDVAADFFNDGFYSVSSGANTVGVWLKDIPAADVRPVVRGHWIDMKPINMETGLPICIKGPDFRCSNCGSAEFQRNFCPNCGADMREANLDATKGGNHD